MDREDTIAVRVDKYDGKEHRLWRGRVVKQTGSLIVLDAVFQEEVEHDLLGTLTCGTISKEYYWLDRWYNVFRFSDRERPLRNFYCNVTMPPRFDGRVLSYVDLDVDVLVNPDFSYQVLDLADFEENAVRFGYSAEVQEKAHDALAELIRLIEARSFPFDE